ncbi:MAG: hypothetical protein MR349_06965 [Spirochaetia bacterium]|nr:hypothetical protein [Spirochaetia bacterium]
MSDSTDTNELDNYGVWVKKPPKDIMPDTDGPDIIDDSFSLDSLDADLPDFDSIDTSAGSESDVTEPVFDIPSEDALDDPFAGVDFGSNDETQESAPTAEAPEVAEDNFSLDEITLDDIDFDTEPVSETSAESTTSADATEEVSTDFEITDNPETSLETETVDIDLDSMEDGEIDLDNFLSDDSSTSSSSSEETVDLSSFGMDDSSTDSVNLDDFLDGGEFSDLNSTGTGTTQKSDEIVDEDPLNINLSFDETANSFSIEDDSEETSENEERSSDSERSTGDDIDTESIDLAEFGVDEENGLMTMQGPEDAINQAKDETINYDLKVNVDTDEGTTVSMSDVIAGTVNKEPEIEEETVTEEIVQAEDKPVIEEAAMSAAGQQILQQLMGELTSLKNEIKDLKSELTDLKSQESEISIESPAEEENTGFFTDGGDDDTIALSGDELDNILNSAEFLEETASTEETEDTTSTVTEESIIIDQIDEPVISELTKEEIEEPEVITEPEVIAEPEEITEPEVIAEPEPEIKTVSNGQFATTIDEDVFSDNSIFEEPADDNVIIEDPVIEESITEEADIEKTEEITAENEISEELPDEIEIPRIEDISSDSEILVSDDSSLTIDTTGIDDEITISPIDEMFEDDTSIESNLTSDKLSYISEDKDNPVKTESPAEESIGDLDLPSPSLDDIDEEPVIEETLIEEPIESKVISEPAPNGEIPGDLKQEIKSVLSYMDQLLENLPEEKISEFAQSEHFVTYKKLFQELGLS